MYKASLKLVPEVSKPSFWALSLCQYTTFISGSMRVYRVCLYPVLHSLWFLSKNFVQHSSWVPLSNRSVAFPSGLRCVQQRGSFSIHLQTGDSQGEDAQGPRWGLRSRQPWLTSKAVPVPRVNNFHFATGWEDESWFKKIKFKIFDIYTCQYFSNLYVYFSLSFLVS